jgi:hypothetical protein
MSVVALFHHGWPHAKTLGELADIGKAVPQEEILSKISHHVREIERIRDAGHTGGPAMLRQLIVLGVMTTRALFEICKVPAPAKRTLLVDPPEAIERELAAASAVTSNSLK